MKILPLLIFFLGFIPITIYSSHTLNDGDANERLLSEVLEELEKEYLVFFNFETNLINGKRVYFSIESGEELEIAIKRLLKKTDLGYELFGKRYIILYKKGHQKNDSSRDEKNYEFNSINSQKNLSLKNNTILKIEGTSGVSNSMKKLLFEKTISGSIKDENDIPLVGASIIEKGTTNGSITDFDGNFTLSVSDDAEILVISYIGYKEMEVAIEGRSTIPIVMLEDAFQLNEVVVTALGIERKKEALSYAISDVSGEDISNKAEPDVLRALNGKVAGVNISQSGGAAGSSTNIIIRGNNSAIGNNQPLFVVDGIPFDNSINNTANPAAAASTYSNRALDLDPNDIASMTVLKGGAAAALYGSRASNGVIIVTTHSGKQARKGLEVELSNTISFESIARLPKYQNRFGQGNFSDGVPVFSSVATESWGPAFDGGLLNGGLTQDGGTIKYTNHIGDLVPYKAFPDNVAEFYETGFQRETGIRIKGGNNSSGFAVTASNVNNAGFLPNTGIKRTSVKVAGNTQLENGLSVNASVTYVDNHQDGILSGGHNTLSSINRQTLFIPRNYDLTGFEYINQATGSQFNYTFWDNPRWLADEGPYNSDVDRIYGFVGLGYDLNEWLNVSYKIGTNTYTDRRNQLIPRGSFFGPGQIIDHTISFSELSSNLILTGNRELSDDISLSFVAGHNFNQRKTDENNYRGEGIIKRGISRVSNTQNIVNDLSFESNRKLIGLFADIGLSYKDYLFFNVTGRNDWSSTLPSQKRSFFYPSISSAFVFTEAFGLDSKLLPYGKLRIAFSRIGNDADPYLLSTVNTINGNAGSLELPFNGVSGTTIGDNFGNLNLRPEFTNEFEIGADLRLFNYKVGLDIAYYSKVTDDQIFSVSIPAVSGYRTKTFNAGEISNKGVEIGLDVTPVDNKNGLSWNIYGVFAKNVSKVISLADGLDQINPGFRTGSYGNVLKVGEPYGVIEGEVQNRYETGELLVNPLTGLPSKATTLDIVGDPNPDFLLGLTNTLSYKGVSMGFQFDWKQGGDLLCLSCGYLRGFGITEETAVDRDRTYILPGILADPNDPTKAMTDENGNTIPNDVQISAQTFWSAAVSGSHANQYRFSAESYIYDATVYRLRELSVSYTIPSSRLESLPIGSASITLIGRNLWFWAPNLPHLDPEVSTYGAGNVQGVEQYAPPTVKNYGVNFKVTF